ncbi:MAG: hypothetical protein ABIM89_09620 [Mycobacteriales bacterium]
MTGHVRHRAALAGACLVIASVHTSPAAAAPGCAALFTPTENAAFSRYAAGRVTAAVYDTRTGCWYHLNRGVRISTASVIKAEVLGAVLLKAQDGRRQLTERERGLIGPMISYSSDTAASALYGHIGGVAGMYAYDRRAGISSTTHDTRYGATSTTAQDRTTVALGLLHGRGPLGPAARAEAWRYLGNVHPTQRWGLTAGNRIGWSAALKNGFYPGSGGRWRVGTTGFVRRVGTYDGYAITVMTTGVADQATGMRWVEAVSARVADVLTPGRIARRPVDRAWCVVPRPGESWRQVAARLGIAPRWPDVRLVSGGNPVPLSRGRACAPGLRESGWRATDSASASDHP